MIRSSRAALKPFHLPKHCRYFHKAFNNEETSGESGGARGETGRGNKSGATKEEGERKTDKSLFFGTFITNAADRNTAMQILLH